MRPKIDLRALKLEKGKAVAESNADTLTLRYKDREEYRELFENVDFKILKIPALLVIKKTMELLSYRIEEYPNDVKMLESNMEMELKIANLEINEAGLKDITDEKLPKQDAVTLLLFRQGIRHNIEATIRGAAVREKCDLAYPEAFDPVYRQFYSEVIRDGIKEVVDSVRAGISRLEEEQRLAAQRRDEGARAPLPEAKKSRSGRDRGDAESAAAPATAPAQPASAAFRATSPNVLRSGK